MRLSRLAWKMLWDMRFNPGDVTPVIEDPIITELLNAEAITEQSVLLWGEEPPEFSADAALMLNQLRAKLEDSLKGKSLQDYKPTHTKLTDVCDQWSIGSLDRQHPFYISKDRCVIILQRTDIPKSATDTPKTEEDVEAWKQLQERLRKRIPSYVKTRRSWKQLTPYAYQLFDFGRFEVIWMTTQRGDFKVAVQTCYMDYFLNRWADAHYYVEPSKVVPTVFVEGSGKATGYKQLVAMIAPVNIRRFSVVPPEVIT